MIRPSGAKKASSISDLQVAAAGGFAPHAVWIGAGETRLEPGTTRGGPSARPSATTRGRLDGLPVVALRIRRGLAAALRRARACTGRDAGGRALRDRERVGRLRDRHDRVAGAGARRGHRDLALTGTDVEAGVAELRRCGAVRVVAGGVGATRLDLRDRVTRVGLGLGVLALLLLAQEGRQGNRGKNADDQDHDEKLDEREALLLAVDPLGKLPQHWYSSLRRLWSCQTPRQPPALLWWQLGRLRRDEPPVRSPGALRPRLATGLPLSPRS